MNHTPDDNRTLSNHNCAQHIIRGTRIYPSRDRPCRGPYPVKVMTPTLEVVRIITHEELLTRDRAENPFNKIGGQG